ncbi:bifunctional hydroxymethylpyrimidine kinase/phosphomethylpyrimidine kinase [Martelella mediterranea]|uniref:hydroxymethylpyrimidine kinase n=1 Tax=Martelella mediterranea DSM 17316 TaxID=1122214 RepID=A0A1U9Z1V3_9HYPH|nr:bifunctional hydroxymethylpyrimidine kinase/phosphomethylpyrimidine kinase [Martelella mediterranea]AQZ51671.1 Hydroxymethylpyrimidine/phosphomethylpyrimidine kinase [Martelella mediterranea DSM 17316]
MIANILSIAGSDPSGGAGIQADLKTFSALGTYGMAALTGLTAQNTRGVTGVHEVPSAFVAEQIAAIFDDVKVNAIKIGMVVNANVAVTIADSLRHHVEVPVVLDPVMVAKGGHRLLPEDAIEALKDHLIPLAAVLTPNLPEAAALLDAETATTRDQMIEQATALRGLGAQAVLLKGGHLEGAESPDLLVTANGHEWLEGARIDTASTHGTGCTLSSAIAAEIGKGAPLSEAVANAKRYVAGAIAAADSLHVGSGHGPTHHFHQLWGEVTKT